MARRTEAASRTPPEPHTPERQGPHASEQDVAEWPMVPLRVLGLRNGTVSRRKRKVVHDVSGKV